MNKDKKDMELAIAIIQNKIDLVPTISVQKAAYEMVGELIRLDSFDELNTDQDFYEVFNWASNLELGESWPESKSDKYWSNLNSEFNKLKDRYK